MATIKRVCVCPECPTRQIRSPGKTEQKTWARDLSLLKNAGQKDDGSEELYQLKVKCLECKRILNILNILMTGLPIESIMKTKTPGVCQYCQRPNIYGNCKICELVVKKCLLKPSDAQNYQEKMRLYVEKIRDILEAITAKGEIFPDTVRSESISDKWLQDVLGYCNKCATVRQPHISSFPPTLARSQGTSEHLLDLPKYDSGSSIDKKNKKVNTSKDNANKDYSYLNKVNDKKQKDCGKKTRRNCSSIKSGICGKCDLLCKKCPTPSGRSSDRKSSERDKEDSIFKMTEKKKKDEGKDSDEFCNIKGLKSVKTLPKFDLLPTLKLVEVGPEGSFSNILECEQDVATAPSEMVKASDIVLYDPGCKKQDNSKYPTRKPLLYSKNYMLFEDDNRKPSHTPSDTKYHCGCETTNKQKRVSANSDRKSITPAKGVMRYELSNRKFINIGWTQLPSTKLMRRMFVYKSIPVKSKMDWCVQNKHKRRLYYKNCELLGLIHENGSSEVYYKNGKLALKYYGDSDQHCGERCIVYSSGEDDENPVRKKHIAILACFDYIGNCSVFDLYGIQRLKYNQTEGMVYDSKIGSHARWKWHHLNDPPVFQEIWTDTELESDPHIEELIKADVSKTKQESNLEMLSIELENHMKEEAKKKMQRFQPIPIKMKALKLNKYFSLRVLDQANVYLLFRDGQNSVRIDLGVQLDNSVITDTLSVDAVEVTTPYDQLPPRSKAVANIQARLNHTRENFKPLD